MLTDFDLLLLGTFESASLGPLFLANAQLARDFHVICLFKLSSQSEEADYVSCSSTPTMVERVIAHHYIMKHAKQVSNFHGDIDH